MNIMGNTICCLECGSEFVHEVPLNHSERPQYLRQPSLPEMFGSTLDDQFEELPMLSNRFERPTLPNSHPVHMGPLSGTTRRRGDAVPIQHHYNLRTDRRMRNSIPNTAVITRMNGGFRRPVREIFNTPMNGGLNENHARAILRNPAFNAEQPHSSRHNDGVLHIPDGSPLMHPQIRPTSRISIIMFRAIPLRSLQPNFIIGQDDFEAVLAHLAEEASESETIGIEPEEVTRIPMIKVTQFHVKKGSQCTTCMEAFVLEEEVARLNCQHIFHRECIIPWLVKNNTCPVCRRVADPQKWNTTTDKVPEVSMKE